MDGKKYEMHLISHTHWDREWRLVSQEFRMKLVDCLDHLLEIMESDPNYKYFTLDGQTIPLEDYLEARPENRERIRKLCRAGRILVGPWYTCIDESLVHGESIVRNLLVGHGIAEEFGGATKTGSAISSFGHIGQLPQIFRGFGIDNAIFSRGISEWQVKSEFIWRSPDGSEVLAFHLPDNYTKSNWFYVVHRPAFYEMEPYDWEYPWGEIGVPFHAADEGSRHKPYRLLKPKMRFNPERIFQQVMQLRKECIEKATTRYLLFMDGVDHLEPNPFLTRAIAEVNKRLKGERLIHSNLEIYMKKVRSAVGKLRVRTGEMRSPSKKGIHNRLFGHVLSSRMYLKQANEKVQTALVRWAEPMATVAYTLGFSYPARFFEMAWKFLLQNHAHDSICGCSVDRVHEDMEHRFKQAKYIADELTQRAFWQIVPEINSSRFEDSDIVLNVFNSLPFGRSEVIAIDLDIPEKFGAKDFVLRDLEGKVLSHQHVSREKVCPEMLNPLNAQLSPHSDRFTVHIPAENVPPCGYTTLVVTPTDKKTRTPGKLATGHNEMENEFLRVQIGSDGTLAVTDKETGMMCGPCNYFEDGGDVGNAWVYMPTSPEEVVSSLGKKARVRLVENGPLLARYEIEYAMLLPLEAEPLKKKVIFEESQAMKRQRGKRRKLLRIVSAVILRRGERRVEVVTRLDNQVKDHRLRVCFRSGVCNAKVSAADSQFDVVERPIKLRDTKGWNEKAFPTHPQLGFVDVSDGKVGLAILNQGLPEYEVVDDRDRTVAVTLLRCVG
ncbi:hypothetical protein HQ563_13075, partial [bacterium]|nr:hypothetical protein [bacterium]